MNFQGPDCSTEGLVVISKSAAVIVIIKLTGLHRYFTTQLQKNVGDEHRHQLGLGGHGPARSSHRDQGDQKQEAQEAEARAQASARGTEKESARVEHNEGTPMLQ